MNTLLQPARWLPLALLLGLASVPAWAAALDDNFLVAFFARVLIYAIAASALNIALGLGGLVSLGHALFLGIGMYSVSLPAHHGVSAGVVHLLICVGVCAGIGAVTGLISLRTSGIAFIMITLAFAQMAYYLFISARAWGGDDGLPLAPRMTLGNWSLSSDHALFYASLACLAACTLFIRRLAQARFGQVIQAIRENETRMEALGYPVFRYKLVCFVLGGALAGLAGALLANLTGMASPNLLQWTQSGTLLVMVIIGGVGYLYGGIAGAVILLTLEEGLVGMTEHWHFILGFLLLGIVLFAPKGIAALFGKKDG